MNSRELLLSITEQTSLLEQDKYYSEVVSFATVGHGISVLDLEEQKKCILKYDNFRGDALKFVPASGAASRMFMHLKGLSNTKSIKALEFLRLLPQMPFIEPLNELCQSVYNCNAQDLIERSKLTELESLILTEAGLNYSNTPKGLIPFHNYGAEVRNAFMEHVIEGLEYVAKNEKCRIHFTVPPQFKVQIEESINEFLKRKSISNVALEFSEQKPETNTVALTKSGQVLTDQEGRLVLRPGGHGALIHNLNDIEADVIFIKNVDNVVKERDLELQVHWKKVLGGKLLAVQEFMHKLVKLLDEGKGEKEAKSFLESEFFYSTSELTINRLKDLLCRPLRVCGMVKNEGQPGGGPFFVRNTHGKSLQIVESAEINKLNESQLRSLKKSTHFNPVDIACAVKDPYGESYNLLEFVNPMACFTSYKEHDEKEIKILELPGLWNGGMSKWNTLFIEVPAATFRPVKTVNDLAKR
ncbi:MAG: DUF4301 family protein [Flavobacteriales bacterium]